MLGCSSAVVVESTFPTPLVQSLPVSVGLIFNDALHDFIHSEQIPQQSTWTIDLGDANIAMLEPLFASMFNETMTVDGLPLSDSMSRRLDGVIQPELERFEFDVPIGQRDEFVEVWMQYKLTLFQSDGRVVTEWPVSGYGKYEVGGKREDAVHRAAIVAMREVGAAIATKFPELPEVSYWLQERQNAASLSASAEPGLRD
jgi:hypothetical protein